MTQQAQQTQPKKLFKSTFQQVIDHARVARAEMAAMSQCLTHLIVDIEKGEDWLRKFEESLIHTIEDNGGIVDVEAEIKNFIPKSYREPEGSNQT